MSEKQIDTNDAEINRRNFLKLAVKSPVVAGAGLLLKNEVDHEKQLAEKGEFETPDGIWHPIYERHDLHEQILVPNHIPAGLNALSVEGNIIIYQQHADGTTTSVNILKGQHIDILSATMGGQDTTPKSKSLWFPDNTKEYIKQHNIPIALGDVACETWETTGIYTKENQTIIRYILGTILLSSGTSMNTLKNVFKKTQTRRKFLKWIGVSTALTGAMIQLPNIAHVLVHDKVMESFKDNSPEKRVWARLMTITENATPEQLNGLFRELIQANKLITLAKHLKNKNPAKKPYIGYNWHIGHRGIEDWLRLGQDVIRMCIMAYPDAALKQIIDVNANDPQALYAIRLLHIPGSISSQNEQNNTSDSAQQNNDTNDVLIEDEVLKHMLEQRGII